MTASPAIELESVLLEKLLPFYLAWKGEHPTPQPLTLETLLADYFGAESRYITPSDLHALLENDLSLEEFKKRVEDRWLGEKVLPLYEQWKAGELDEDDLIDPAEIQALLDGNITMEEFLRDA